MQNIFGLGFYLVLRFLLAAIALCCLLSAHSAICQSPTVVLDQAEAFRNQRNYGKARQYYLQALNLYRVRNDREGLGAAYFGLGEVAIAEDSSKVAVRNYELAIQEWERLNQPANLARAYAGLATGYLLQDQTQRAQRFAEGALKLAQGDAAARTRMEIHRLLTDIYRKQNLRAQSERHLTLYVRLRDSLNTVAQSEFPLQRNSAAETLPPGPAQPNTLPGVSCPHGYNHGHMHGWSGGHRSCCGGQCAHGQMGGCAGCSRGHCISGSGCCAGWGGADWALLALGIGGLLVSGLLGLTRMRPGQPVILGLVALSFLSFMGLATRQLWGWWPVLAALVLALLFALLARPVLRALQGKEVS